MSELVKGLALLSWLSGDLAYLGESKVIPQDTTSCLGSGVLCGFSVFHSTMAGLVLPRLLGAAFHHLSSRKSIQESKAG